MTTSKKFKNILLIGAYGFTGQLILEGLVQSNIRPTIAGRDLEKLESLKNQFHCESLAIDTLNEEQVASIVAGFDVLINCVGPFLTYSSYVIAKAAELGKVYIDITGEQNFVFQTYQKLRHTASKNQATLIPSLAFESALADFASCLICRPNESYLDISSYYYLDSIKPSPGTRRTLGINKSNLLFKDGNYVEAHPATVEKEIEYPQPLGNQRAYFLPYPEILFFKEQFHTANAGSYVVLSDTEARLLQMRAAELRPNDAHKTPTVQNKKLSGPTLEQRHNSRFVLAIRALQKDCAKQINLSGVDPYGITANLVVFAVKKILGSQDLPIGVLAPSQVFNPIEVAAYLKAQCGLSITIDE